MDTSQVNPGQVDSPEGDQHCAQGLVGWHDEGEPADAEDDAQAEENVREKLWVGNPLRVPHNWKKQRLTVA